MDNGVWEIEELEESTENVEQQPSRPHKQLWLAEKEEEEDVYIAVGKVKSSMDALEWALKHLARPSTFVYLIHVFPHLHNIPSPLGMIPVNQVSAQQLESFMSQVRSKRQDLLQTFLEVCYAKKVNADVHLIESDTVAKAVAELIPVLNIKRLVVGTTKSNLRKLKKGTSKAEQIYKSAPHYCEVKIICDGKEVSMVNQLPSSTPPSSQSDSSTGNGNNNNQQMGKYSVSCLCFNKGD